MHILKIDKLRKVYSSNVVALNEISLQIPYGSFFALLGKNGAGKSTTIGIITSLIKKTSGKIYINNFDLDYDFMKIKSFIGFVSQEYNFNQFETVLDIILNQAGYYGISRGYAYLKAKYFLDIFDLWNSRNFISMRLSGGMKRRLMLIRALIHNPKILILDEPTAGVDILTRRLIWNYLRDLNKSGVTVILTTHYLEEVEYLCDTVSIIDNGNILLNTTVKDLLKKINNQVFVIELDINNVVINLLKKNNYNFLIIDNTSMEIIISFKKTLNDLFEIFIINKIIIYNIRNKSNRLEELFIDLTT